MIEQKQALLRLFLILFTTFIDVIDPRFNFLLKKLQPFFRNLISLKNLIKGDILSEKQLKLLSEIKIIKIKKRTQGYKKFSFQNMRRLL